MRTEVNVYSISNLHELSSSYRLYQIRGLSPDQNEYHQNKQSIVRRVSFALRAPATIIKRDGSDFLVLPADCREVPPSPFILFRGLVVEFIPKEVFELDFAKSERETDDIRTRFLQFEIQSSLFRNPKLWQPESGK